MKKTLTKKEYSKIMVTAMTFVVTFIVASAIFSNWEFLKDLLFFN
ncbi:hypothetical protein [uncultured Lacinutrix sp.]|nr:hypothetical protein [uncultured Lacinutrix sp.]